MGIYYRDGMTKNLLADAGGEEMLPVAFKPEPDNPHDPLACQVYALLTGEWVHVGYIPRTVSGLFLRLFQDSAEFEAHGVVRLGKNCPELLVSVSVAP